MNKFAFGPAALFLLMLGFTGCQFSDDKKEEGVAVDSVLNQILDSSEVKQAARKPVVPELLGTWVVVKMTLDETTELSQDVIGKMTYTFNNNGKLIFDPKSEFDPETFDYSYDQNVIKTAHFPKEEARITKLNADSLVFVIEAAGEVEYILEKKK